MNKLKYFMTMLILSALLLALPVGIAAKEMGRPFNDVTKNAWYYNDVYNAYANHFFYGTAANTFAPKDSMTRAMLVTVLYRMAGSPSVNESAAYTDVDNSSYYAPAVRWSTEQGIVEGFPDGTFGPNIAVTREQMVKIIYGYYTAAMKGTPANAATLDNFADKAEVASWSAEAMEWAVGNKIIYGSFDDNVLRLMPGQASTRSQVAAILVRFAKDFNGLNVQDYKATTISDSAIMNESNKVNEYWFGGGYDSLNRPAEPIRVQNAYGDSYNLLSIGPDQPRTIYLTFDEGYENGYTPRILDTLKEKEVKAVFFVTLDFVEHNPGLVQRMIDEGHVIGNHTCAHPAKGMPSLSLDAQRNDIEKLQNILRNKYDYEMTLFRFPAGIYSMRSLAIVNSLHMKSVFWSFAYGDYDPKAQPGQSASLNKLNARIHPGAVYLLHAVSSTNTAILPKFIDNARGNGYSFSLMVNN